MDVPPSPPMPWDEGRAAFLASEDDEPVVPRGFKPRESDIVVVSYMKVRARAPRPAPGVRRASADAALTRR